MVTGIRPGRGGFLRPFGCGFFIRDFLLGRGPEYGVPSMVKCRYHSFVMYFGMLKKLEWVESTREEEVSTPQDYYEGFEPRRYYRLTKKGREAADYQWSNPYRTLYPQFDEAYFREKRAAHTYVKKAPTKSRRR